MCGDTAYTGSVSAVRRAAEGRPTASAAAAGTLLY
jgi:hypothetical protein